MRERAHVDMRYLAVDLDSVRRRESGAEQIEVIDTSGNYVGTILMTRVDRARLAEKLRELVP